MKDLFRVGKYKFKSRLIVGTGKYKNFSETAKAVTPANLAARSYVQNLGDGSATSYAVTHSLNTRDVIVQLYDNSTYDTVFADVVRTNTTTVTISFASAPSSNDIRVLVTKVD